MKPEDEIKNSNPFKVPAGYFENLTERTMSSICEARDAEGVQEKRPVRKIRLRHNLALAAIILGLAVLASAMIRLVTGSAKDNADNQATELYTDLALDDIDTYLIESELSQTATNKSPGLDETVTSEEIIDYLVHENIDFDDIYALL